MPRYRGRPDANHRELASFAESLGALVEDIPGDTTSPGRPDLLWVFRGRVGLAEVKAKPKAALRDTQVTWHARAKARGVTVDVWRTRADVLRSLGLQAVRP